MSTPVGPHFRAPRGILADFVELFWLYESYAVAHPKEQLLPGATTELVFDLRPGARQSTAAVVAGPRSRYSVLDTSEEAMLVGVHFKPGGGFPFFGVPAGELHNEEVSLDVLWGPKAAQLREQVLAAPTPDAKFDLLERALLSAARTFARHRAVTFALRQLSSPRASSVTEVANATGLSQRWFTERFRAEVGMTPKLFARVQRFQRVVQTIHPLAQVDWADVASACGYFDQAHFIHDFRAFSGFTPAAYLALKSVHQNHVPLAE